MYYLIQRGVSCYHLEYSVRRVFLVIFATCYLIIFITV